MSINKVILVGNVGKDPEVRYLDKNVAVANFTLATTERGYKTTNGIEVPERTEWHNIVLWRGLAETAEKYVKKGSQLYIEGKLQTRSWEKDGVKRYTTEIVADVMQMLGRKPDSGGGFNNGSVSGGTQTNTVAEVPPAPFEAPGGDSADDLPF